MTDYAETTTTPLYPSASATSRQNGGLVRRLSLKPYGDELLTKSGDFWIFSARLIIIAMALAEAIAWGYVGSLMSSEYPLITAGVAAVFVFVLIWVIDTSFMTLDLSHARYERTLAGRKDNQRLEALKLASGVLARIAIVTASLIITAPFLAQAIFSGDVREEMERRNANLVSSQRQSVDQPFLARTEALRLEQNALEQQRIGEAAGVGPSGRHGRGPAVETIERQLADKREEIGAGDQARAAALTRFDGLSTEQLEHQYGLGFITPGVNSSAAVLEEMSDDPLFGRAEIAVRAFLGFLFLGLLILKAFQPRSISIYFSEQLQSLYDGYRKGIFDPYLPAAERAQSGGSIDPLRFEDWCLTTYAAIRDEEQRRRVAASGAREHELRVEQWQRLEISSRREMEPLTRQLDESLMTMDRLEQELHRDRATVASLSEELDQATATHESMIRHLDGNAMDGTAFGRAMDAIAQLDEKRRSAKARIRDLEGAIESDGRQLDLHQRTISELRQQIETKQSVITEAQKRISDERLALASMVTSR